MTNTEVHVRAGELAASVAVDAGKAAMVVRTHFSQDAEGFSHKVAVTDVMWSGTTTGGPMLIFVLENGQEFEAEVKPSSKALREARLAVEAATLAAQRAQDNAKNGS